METKKERGNCQTSPSPAGTKSVTFDEEVIETSIGGTQSTGKIKLDHIAALKVVSGKSDGKKNSKYPTDITDVPDTPKSTKGNCGRSQVSSANEKQTNSFTMVPDCFRTPTMTPTKSRRHTLESRIFNTPDCYRVVQMETPRKFDLSYDDSTDMDDDDDCTSVTVAVRVRPPSQRFVFGGIFVCVSIDWMDRRTDGWIDSCIYIIYIYIYGWISMCVCMHVCMNIHVCVFGYGCVGRY